jgi:hypothetical protein
MNILGQGKSDPDDARDINVADELIEQGEARAKRLADAQAELQRMQREILLTPPRNYPDSLPHAEIVSILARTVAWDFNDKPFPAAVSSMQKAIHFTHATAMFEELKNAQAVLSCDSDKTITPYQRHQLLLRITVLLQKIEYTL